MNGWARSFHSVTPKCRSDRSDDYVGWLMASVWAEEKKRITLIEEIESDLAEPSEED